MINHRCECGERMVYVLYPPNDTREGGEFVCPKCDGGTMCDHINGKDYFVLDDQRKAGYQQTL